MSYFASNEMKKDGGSIVNLASINGFVGYNQGIDSNLKGINPYPHSKGGVIQLTKDMAVGLAKQNIRVNALSAGPVKTLAGAAISGARHVFRYSENVSPLKFNPQLKEIGCGALYLTSDLSSGVTGNVHHVDGGLHSVAIPKQENLE